MNATPSPNTSLLRYVLEFGVLRYALPITILSELIAKPIFSRVAPFSDLHSTLIFFLSWAVVYGGLNWFRSVYLPRLDVKD